jgi:hypothetical protein
MEIKYHKENQKLYLVDALGNVEIIHTHQHTKNEKKEKKQKLSTLELSPDTFNFGSKGWSGISLHPENKSIVSLFFFHFQVFYFKIFLQRFVYF